MVRIREQFEVQSFLGAELLMGVRRIDADAENHGVFLLVLRQVALEIVGFFRAAAGEILGVEVQHHPLAAIIVQID